VWVIEKFWKHIWIQHPKIHQKWTLFLMGQNLCWPVLSVVVFYFLYCVGTDIELSVLWLCYGLDDPGFQSWTGKDIFLFSKMFRLTGAHPASYHWVTQLVPRNKVANHSPPFIAEVKTERLPQYTFVERVWKTLLTSYTLFTLYLLQFTVKDKQLNLNPGSLQVGYDSMDHSIYISWDASAPIRNLGYCTH